jgi:thioredoxin 1
MAAIEINREQFFEISKEDKPVLVDFWAPWCVYCRRLGPAYDRIANEYGDKINVVKINIDEEPEFSDAEQIEVIPTLVLYKNGKAIDSIVVPDSKAMIDDFIRQAMEK